MPPIALLTESKLTTTKSLRKKDSDSEARVMSDWSRDVDRAFEELSSLEEGWDGGQARPIENAVLEKARQLLERTMCDDSPAPAVVPDSDGALSLEWKLPSGISLEVDFDIDGDACVGYRNSSSPIKGEWDADEDLDRLKDAIGEIAASLN